MEQTISLLLSLLLPFLLSILKQIILPSKPIPPPHIPSVSPLPLLARFLLNPFSIPNLPPILRRLHAVHGPILSLRLLPLSKPSIFISSPSLSHSSLILNSATFANRPSTTTQPNLFLTANSHNIASSSGPLWRLLRRNLSSQTLHHSRIRLFASGRRWALRNLLHSLRSQSSRGEVVVKHSFQQAISSLFILMCFGEKLSAGEIKDVEADMVFLLGVFTSFNFFAVLPTVTKLLFHRRWKRIVDCRRRQAEIFVPLIRAREERKKLDGGLEFCYVDSLLKLEIAEEGGRGLRDDEMVALCHEFLSAGIDTTTTALEWTMAELVKNQGVQAKLCAQIEKEGFREEGDLQRMPYLKAVVMESLRRHPPGHFVLPHAVNENVTVGGFVIAEGTEVNFAVADVNWDGRNWEEAMKFRPERFMEGGEGEGVDISGSREIRMMTFGAGRRICPGYGLAMLQLELFVANLVKEFEWRVEEGGEVDMSERLEFTTVMKNPLRARLFPRSKK